MGENDKNNDVEKSQQNESCSKTALWLINRYFIFDEVYHQEEFGNINISIGQRYIAKKIYF
jgi:hypothetical protein